MPIYQNSIIYKLCHQNDLNNENIYIGSTTNFRTRKNRHKLRTTNKDTDGYNVFVYQFIRDNGGWDEWQMIPIEVFPCNGKEELEIRERYHIELLKSKLNKIIPTRTQKEYKKENKQKIKHINKEYYQQTKEERNEKVKCEYCSCEINIQNLKRHQNTKKCLEKQNIINSINGASI